MTASKMATMRRRGKRIKRRRKKRRREALKFLPAKSKKRRRRRQKRRRREVIMKVVGRMKGPRARGERGSPRKPKRRGILSFPSNLLSRYLWLLAAPTLRPSRGDFRRLPTVSLIVGST